MWNLNSNLTFVYTKQSFMKNYAEKIGWKSLGSDSKRIYVEWIICGSYAEELEYYFSLFYESFP